MTIDATFFDTTDSAPEIVYAPTPDPGFPGSDTTPVPTSDPWGQVTGIFGKVASGISTAADIYTGVQKAKFDTQFRIQQQQLGSQIALARLNGANAIDAARIAAETQIARNQFARMPGLTALFGGTTAPSSGDFLMLAMTAAGLFFAWKSVKKA